MHDHKPDQETTAPPWGEELLHRLDWRRFFELTQSLLVNSGMGIWKSEVLPDTTTLISVTRGNDTARPVTVIQVAGWNGFHVTYEDVVRFRQRLRMDWGLPGIMITPGQFSPDAANYAKLNQIELIDSSAYINVLRRLPSEKGPYLFSMATKGDYTTPSCPRCMRKLTLEKPQDAKEALPAINRGDSTVRCRRSAVVKEDLICYKLIVKQGIEMHFLGNVTAAYIEVYGKAIGDFTCLTKMTVGEGAIVSGTVTARTMNVEEGGVVDGTANIVNAPDISPTNSLPERLVWRCPNKSMSAACREVQLEPRN